MTGYRQTGTRLAPEKPLTGLRGNYFYGLLQVSDARHAKNFGPVRRAPLLGACVKHSVFREHFCDLGVS